MSAQSEDQAQRRPLLVGQRLNGSGSRQVRRLLLAGDAQGLIEVARAQIAAGAQALDVCAAIPDVPGEAERLRWLVALLARATAAPLLIDSAGPEALIAGLSACPRPAIVNSVNLVDRRRWLDRIAPIALGRGDAVIGQTIDAHGPATTAAEKLRLAERLVRILVVEYGLAPESIVIDPVLLPVGRNGGGIAETLRALRAIKAEFPAVRTVLGISNVSFGAPPRLRPHLNARLLRAAGRAGLDLAIVDPAYRTVSEAHDQKQAVEEHHERQHAGAAGEQGELSADDQDGDGRKHDADLKERHADVVALRSGRRGLLLSLGGPDQRLQFVDTGLVRRVRL